MRSAVATLKEFDLDSIPDLDLAVLGALSLFQEAELPRVSPTDFSKPLVVGSVNAFCTAKILFSDTKAVFANESNYQAVFQNNQDVSEVVILSASGSKHAISMAKFAKEAGKEVVLFTNNAEAPAAEFVSSGKLFVFPKNREPYTYNTSTYLGMILAMTKENPEQILSPNQW